jgi:AcrR family transcriptional regulator
MKVQTLPRKGERTRLRILEESIKVIAAKGFEGLVLTDIASQAGISRGGLLQHFESRENLIAETSKFLMQHGRDVTAFAMTELTDEPDPILRYIRATFEWGKQNRDEVVLLVYLMNRSGHEESSRNIVNDIFNFAYQRIALLLAQRDNRQAQPDRLGAVEMTDSEKQILNWQRGARIVHSILLGFIVRIPLQAIPKSQMNLLEEECLFAIRPVLSEFARG